MAEDISDVWPGPEDVALPDSEDEDANLIEEAADLDVNEGRTRAEAKGKGKEVPAKKHGLMALPSEIRETYVLQSTKWGISTSPPFPVNLDHAER